MRICFALLLLLLVGCTSTPKHAPTLIQPSAKAAPQLEQQWQQHQQQVSSIRNWQATGRLAVSQGHKGNNASFVWDQFGDSYKIKLFGPFGSGSVYIIGSPHSVQVKEANGKTTTAQSPELLLKKIAGWNVPLSGLHYWLRGLPTPQGQAATPQLNQNGYLRTIQQQGWTVNVDSYHADSFVPLPNKLHLQNKDLKIKMVVTSWKKLTAS